MSLQILHSELRRDIYNLQHPGFPLHQVTRPDPDPLATVGYSCVYWVDHLADSSGRMGQEDLSQVYSFLQQEYLYWLEALSLISELPAGIVSLDRLKTLLQVGYFYNLMLFRNYTDLK